MLVYIRESDKDKIICNVDEKDIAEHLRVSCLLRYLSIESFYFQQSYISVCSQIRLEKDREEKERRKKEKAEAHLYTIIKVFESTCWAQSINCFKQLCVVFSLSFLTCLLPVQVARDDDLTAQIGKDIYFDLVDHDKVPSFRIQKQMPFTQFKVITWGKTMFAVMLLLAYSSCRNIESGCCLLLVVSINQNR